MFTQKHYVAIENMIQERRQELKTDLGDSVGVRLDEVNMMTLALSKLFKADNSKFKEFTFIESCNRDLKE